MASVGLSRNGEGNEEGTDNRRSELQINSCNCSSSSMEKLKMDDGLSSSSDHRRSMSENTSHSWETEEDESLSRLLNIGSSEELQNLMEDREIASRAVAFVVNSTRKGFVPLCANVASLMKSKRRLEKKVARLKREVEVLRSLNPSGAGSKRLTPTSLDSLSSDKDVFMDPAHIHVFNELLKENYQCSSASCSRSSSSSQVSNSPKPLKKQPKATQATSEAGTHVVTVHVHHTNEGTQKQADPGDQFGDHVDMDASKSRKTLSKACDAVSGPPPETEMQSVSVSRARNQSGLTIPNGRARGASSHGGAEMLCVNGHCENDNVDLTLASELAASRLEIERLTLRLKQYELHGGNNCKNGCKLSNDVSDHAELSSCMCRTPCNAAVAEAVRLDECSRNESSKGKDISSSVARHSKFQKTTSQDLKDGSLNTSEDNRRSVSIDSESVVSSVKESVCNETAVDSKEKLSKSPSNRNQARPLHRSKALNKQTNQSKFNYIHTLESSNQSDRHLV